MFSNDLSSKKRFCSLLAFEKTVFEQIVFATTVFEQFAFEETVFEQFAFEQVGFRTGRGRENECMHAAADAASANAPGFATVDMVVPASAPGEPKLVGDSGL